MSWLTTATVADARSEISCTTPARSASCMARPDRCRYTVTSSRRTAFSLSTSRGLSLDAGATVSRLAAGKVSGMITELYDVVPSDCLWVPTMGSLPWLTAGGNPAQDCNATGWDGAVPCHSVQPWRFGVGSCDVAW